MPVYSTSLAVAAVLMQLCYWVFLVIGIVWMPDPAASIIRPEDLSRSAMLTWALAILALSITLLLLTPGLGEATSPYFAGLRLPRFDLQRVLIVVFVANLIATSRLISGTTGIFGSPLSPVLTCVPPLAIFLRQPVLWVIVYALFIFFFSLWSLFNEYHRQDNRDEGVRFAMMSAALLLTTLIGVITRPT